MLTIYNYTEVHKFLKDSFQEKKRENPSFSMSAWARQLGLENSSPLSLAFRGHRTLPKKYIPEVVKSLKLSTQEGQYLEALVDLSKAKKPEQRFYYLNLLKDLSPNPDFNNTQVDAYKALSDPLYSSIIEMTEVKGFQPNARWIKNKLAFSVSVEEVEDALSRLIELNLLTDIGPKRLNKTNKNLTTENDVADLSTKKYHKRISEIALEQVFKQDVSEREFSSYGFNMRAEDLPKAKEKMRAFLNEFFDEFEAEPYEALNTYQFNLQLFKMTK